MEEYWHTLIKPGEDVGQCADCNTLSVVYPAEDDAICVRCGLIHSRRRVEPAVLAPMAQLTSGGGVSSHAIPAGLFYTIPRGSLQVRAEPVTRLDKQASPVGARRYHKGDTK